jgi:hypothetical protein
MGKVQGVKEKLHYPVYDAFFVKGRPNPDVEESDTNKAQTFIQAMNDPRMIRLFVDVQNKTKLETNLQSSGVLPSLNTFETRAMRVVISTPQVSAETSTILGAANKYCCDLKDAEGENQTEAQKIQKKEKAEKTLVSAIQTECDRTCTSASLILTELIYNSVTTLLVGEKIMIETPTYFFPSGAGIHPGNGKVSNHGEPDPMATFRFAEPVIIEPQQNFRVEMLFPQGVPKLLAQVKGPFRIWAVLDGYLTRDVQ